MRWDRAVQVEMRRRRPRARPVPMEVFSRRKNVTFALTFCTASFTDFYCGFLDLSKKYSRHGIFRP